MGGGRGRRENVINREGKSVGGDKGGPGRRGV